MVTILKEAGMFGSIAYCKIASWTRKEIAYYIYQQETIIQG